MMKDLFANKISSKIPIWFMRQAGRYLPEYREIRNTTKNFLEFCYSPDKAAEVTLQPIKRFGFDAAIIFSDILVLPDSLGWDVRFEEGTGPILKQFTNENDFKFLENSGQDRLTRVYEAISIVRAKLNKETSLIGFAGAPWTVATYMIEGKGKQDYQLSKKFIYEQPELISKLIDLLTEKTIMHLIGQIKSGVDIIQIFDSWAGILPATEYEEYVINPTRKIVAAIKSLYPTIPIIGFPKNSGFLYNNYIDETGIDAISVCHSVPLEIMKGWQEKIIVQGNLDPITLLTNKFVIEKKLEQILSSLSKNNFIFNLGHGILPSTPIENVQFVVDYVQNFK